METLFIGRNIIFLPEVDSTNSYAISLLKNVKATEGTVIHTANQTRGKGQRGNLWNTKPESNLTASVILKPTFLDLKKQYLLYEITALACYDVMAEMLGQGQFDIKIKWPNDILVNDRKIGGILIENIISGQLITHSVVGVGINVKQCEFDQKLKATSLEILSETKRDPGTVLSLLCGHLEKWYLQLKNGHMDAINSAYLSHFYKLNEWQEFETDNGVKKLLIKGVSESGLLLLEDASGQGREYDVKEVKWIY